MNKIWCWIFEHKYYVVQKFSNETRRVGCRRCPKTFGMNDRVKSFIPWDGELAELHGVPYPDK